LGTKNIKLFRLIKNNIHLICSNRFGGGSLTFMMKSNKKRANVKDTLNFFDTCSTAVRLLFDSCSSRLRLCFGKASTPLRLLFESCSTVVRQFFVSASGFF